MLRVDTSMNGCDGRWTRESMGGCRKRPRHPNDHLNETRDHSCPRGWRNTVGNLVELVWLNETYHGLQCTGICANNRGVRLHRVRDFNQYYSNSPPPTSHYPVWFNMIYCYHYHSYYGSSRPRPPSRRPPPTPGASGPAAAGTPGHSINQFAA